MPRITITISDEDMEKLREISIRLKISPEDILRISVEEFLTMPEDSVEDAIRYVLEKNEDLYERLS